MTGTCSRIAPYPATLLLIPLLLHGQNRDFGDLPDDSIAGAPIQYQTKLASGGPFHEISPELFLGSQADAEPDGQPTASADGDDGAASDDEDGISTSGIFEAGGVASFNITYTNSFTESAILHVFIDWDGDGFFRAANEFHAELLDSAPDGKTFDLHLPVPGDALPDTQLGARFRLTTRQLSTPNESAPNGEIEDLVVEVDPGLLDFGDLPDRTKGTVPGDFTDRSPDYQTRLLDNGPRHRIIQQLTLANDSGSADADIDAETDGSPSDDASGDDARGDDDETGPFVLLDYNVVTPLPADCEELQLNVEIELSHAVLNALGEDAFLHTFIDWNCDGDFLDSGEQYRTTVPSSATSATQTVSSVIPWPGEESWTETWALRTRLSSTAELGSTGYAPDGEVHDDILSFDFALDNPCPNPQTQLLDFGDLPDKCLGTRAGSFDGGSLPDYQTVLADDGPRHVLTSGLAIRTAGDGAPDFEPNGQPNPLATGDDDSGINDEAGLLTTLSSSSFIATTPIELSTLEYVVDWSLPVVNTTGSPAYLHAFIDGNRDGDFQDTGESASFPIPGDGSVTSIEDAFTITVPWNGRLNWEETFALRFRLSSLSSLTATGPAPDGEVEDHLLSFSMAISDPYAEANRVPPFELDLEDYQISRSQGGILSAELLLPENLQPATEVEWLLGTQRYSQAEVLLDQQLLDDLASGQHPLALSFTSPDGQKRVAYFDLTLLDNADYDAWSVLNQLDLASSAPSLDPDGDGYNTWEEYAFGSKPDDANSIPRFYVGRVESGSETYLTKTYLRRVGGIPFSSGVYRTADMIYTPEGSGNLETWPLATGSADFHPVPLTILPPLNYEWATVRLLDPMNPANAPGFLRVKVEQACPPH